jgi:hypothetical protein
MGLKTATVFVGLLILLTTTTGCLYPAHLDPASTKYAQTSSAPTDSNYATAIQTNYQNAMRYAVDTQGSYRCFLVNNAEASEGFGLLMIAAGGASVGLAAASASTLAIAELGIGGGTLLGSALWLQNKPKINAYLTGVTADQCVIDNGVLLQTAVSRAPEIYAVMEQLRVPLALLDQAVAGLPQDQKDIAARGDQAMATGQAALAAAELSGAIIIRSVEDVDARVFAAAYKGEPDIAALSGSFTSLQKLPFSQQSTKPAAAAGGAGAPTLATVVDLTNELQNLTGGLTLPTKDFASSCLTDLNQGIAQAALQVLPSNNISCDKGATCTLTIVGGRPPYQLIKDANLTVNTTVAGSVTVASVSVSDTNVHNLQIVDMSSAIQSVTITGKGTAPAPAAPAAD